MLVAAFPPFPVFLPPASRIILSSSSSSSSPTVPVFQRCVQGSIRPWMASSPSPSSPTIQWSSGFSSSSSSSSTAGRFLSAAAPVMRASTRVVGMAVLSADSHPLASLNDQIIDMPSHATPLTLSQLTHSYQPAAQANSRCCPLSSREPGGDESSGARRVNLSYSTRRGVMPVMLFHHCEGHTKRAASVN